jgi:hypothetical protein
MLDDACDAPFDWGVRREVLVDPADTLLRAYEDVVVTYMVRLQMLFVSAARYLRTGLPPPT